MSARRSSAAFTIVVAVVMLLCALGMGFLLLLSGAPTALVTGMILASLPLAPLIACYLWLDRYEPEPRSLLVLGLGWGAFVATAIALLLQLFEPVIFRTTDAFHGTVVAPVTEEGCKGLFILLLLFYRRQELDGILDGIVYAGMVGIGFAFTENILYLTSAYMGSDGRAGGLGGAAGLFVVRCLFGPFAHPFFTAFTGIGIGIAVGSRNRAVRVLAPLGGYLVAVAAHASWNASLMLDGGRNAVATYFFLMVPAFLLLLGFAVWSRRREGRVLTEALTDCAQRGFLDPAEVPWLSRIPARRFARQYAEKAVASPAVRREGRWQSGATRDGRLPGRGRGAGIPAQPLPARGAATGLRRARAGPRRTHARLAAPADLAPALGAGAPSMPVVGGARGPAR